MFKAIKKWWNGLWEKEESPGPKITREDIAKVEETVKEIRSGKFDRAKPTGTDAEIGQLKPFQRKHVEQAAKTGYPELGGKYVNHDAKAAPVRPPKPKPIRGRDIKLSVSSHVTVQRGVDGPVETEIVNGVRRDVKPDSLTIHYAENPIESGLGISADITRVERNGCVAHVDGKGNLLPLRGMDHDGEIYPGEKKILPAIEMSFVAEPGIDINMLRKDAGDESLEETVAARLLDPKPVCVELDELDGDTPVPVQRKPRRRGKRGGVKRNRRNKNK